MKIILSIMLVITSFLSYSQEYPKIELNQKGEKVVIFTLSQAQKIDNDLEILNILEKSKIQCDSLNVSYIKIVDAQNHQIVLFEKSLSELKLQINDKDSQIDNLSTQIKNLEESNKICDEQKCIKDKQMDGLKKDLQKEKIKKWLFGGVGLAVGILAILIAH
jgi:hypothetical protein